MPELDRLPEVELEPEAEEPLGAPLSAPRRREPVTDGWIRVFAAEWASRRPEAQKLQDLSGASLRR